MLRKSKKRKTHSVEGLAPEYPQKLQGGFRSATSELAAVGRALANGLDPNVLWREEDLIIPSPKGGCVPPSYVPGSAAWPHYNTPLHRAMLFADFETADLLLRRGADVDLYNSLGRTPLHEAVWNGEHKAVSFLLARKADVDKATVEAHVRDEDYDRDLYGREGELCVHRALITHDAAALRMLVDAGADLCPDSQRPWTALDLALLAEDPLAGEVLLPGGIELLAELPTPDGADFDCAGDSERLLAFTRTMDLVPPPELHLAYCYALRQAKERGLIGPGSSKADAIDLVREVFEALRGAAGHQEHHTNMCAPCRTFQSEASRTFATRTPLTFQLHVHRDQLDDSARGGCPLCSIAADALDITEKEAWSDDDPDGSAEKRSADSPVTLETKLGSYDSPSDVFMDSVNISCGKLSQRMVCVRLGDSAAIPPSKGPDNPDEGTGSASAMHVAKRWLQVCKSDGKHEACRRPYGDPGKRNTWPARLLFIGDPGGDPRIVAAEDIRAPYCALSYCLGEKESLATIRANLPPSMDGIPLGSLPAVMVDAISVARTLGYRYLWIDALCIVRDDKEDWAQEASHTYDIFSNADLTISTLVGSDTRTRLFQPRSLRAAHPVPLHIQQPKRSRGELAILPEWAKRDPGIHGSVHARAWALQEQLASRRILYFGAGMLHWECLAAYRLEADPSEDQVRMYSYRSVTENRVETKRVMRAAVWEEASEDGSSSLSARPFEFWKKTLEEFTRRELRCASDRLAAFASVSGALAGVAGQRSVGGIWDGDRLLESLCWRVAEPRPGTGIPDMPSWTWTSVDGVISFDAVDRAGRKSIETIPGATVESVHVKVDESMSRVSGSITIRGKLCRKTAFNPRLAKSSRLGMRMLDGPGCVFFDHAVVGHVEDLYAVSVLSFPRGPKYKGYGRPRWPNGRDPTTVRLLLQSVGSGSDVFRRVGLGLYPSPPEDIVCEVGGKKPTSSLEWLRVDEEVFEDRQIVIV